MSSSAAQYFQNPQYPVYPQYYTPMINVPTTNRLPANGEMAASIELLIAQVSELSRKIDRVESRVNDWVNLGIAERMTIAEKSISSLKTCHNENSAKIHTAEVEIDDLFGYLKEAKEHANDNDKCIDRFSDILSDHSSKLRRAKHRSHGLSKKCAEIGILRRRVSKCEEFNTEFSECFEAPLQLRGIISHMSDKVDECDRTITYMMRYGSEVEAGGSSTTLDSTIPEYSTFCEGYKESKMGEIDASTLDEYFSNYVDTIPSVSMEENNKENENQENQEDDEAGENVPVNAESDDEFVEL